MIFRYYNLENTLINISGKIYRDTDVSGFLSEFGNNCLQEVYSLENEFHYNLIFRLSYLI